MEAAGSTVLPCFGELETLMCLAQSPPSARALFQSKGDRKGDATRLPVHTAYGLASWEWVQSSRKGEPP